VIDPNLLRDPAVLVPLATFILGWGAKAAKDAIRWRLERRIALADLKRELAKRTPELDDDQRAEIEQALAKNDLAAFEKVVGKADNSMVADLLNRLLKR
jgi:hypothetical protein